MANRTERSESAESIRDQSGFPLSSAEMQMKIELRALGGGPGISVGIPSPTAKSQQPREDLALLRPSIK